MNKKLIIIEGSLASGKTTFALRLSRQLQVPCLAKDNFKTALCRQVPVMDRKTSSLFSAVTFDAMLYAAERMCEAGYPVILEGNFVPAGVKPVDEAGRLKKLIATYEYEALDFKFSGNVELLYKRFLERENTPERGAANRIGTDVPFHQFETWCSNLEGFHVGENIIRVDTSDFAAVDFDSYIEIAREFLRR